MSGDSISVYYGEFLVSPVPLELSFNFCSHRCGYCFANLNKPERKADVGATMRLLADFQNRITLEALLLREGYPVLISNRVDPFATSNYQQAVPVMRAMTQMDIPVAIQTRGAASKPAHEAMMESVEFLKPSVWYLSIGMLDDGIRRKIEPGAPTIESRFELMRELKKHGHRVVLGFNPAVEDWEPQPEKLLRYAKECGAEGAWIESLHLNYKQVAAMPERDQKAIGEDLLKRAQKRKATADDASYFESARAAAVDCGLEVFSMGQTESSGFFQAWQDCYAKTFPSNQDLVNAVNRDWQDGEIVSFDEWATLFEDLPQGVHRLDSYIGATAHQVMRTHKVPSRMTYRELLMMIWSDPRIKSCPARLDCFSYAAKRDDNNEWQQFIGDDGLPYLLFSRAGFTEYYSEAGAAMTEVK